MYSNTILPTGVDETMAVFAEMAVGKKSLSTIPLQAKDGTLISVESKIKQGRWDDRDVFFGISRDVTQRKEAEEELRQSRERYRRLIDLSPEAIGVHREGGFVYMNPVGIELLGAKDIEELKSRSLMEYLHPDFRHKAKERIQRCYEGKTRAGFDEAKLIRLNGQVLDTEIATAPIIDNKKPAALIVIRDITDRKHAKERIRENEERLRVVFEAAENVSFIITDARDPEPFIIEFSPGAEKIFGYGREEMIGTIVSRPHIPEDIAKFPEMHRLMREGAMGFSGVTTLVRRSGERFPALFTTYSLLDEEGNMYAALGVSVDLTEQKEAEDALRESEERLNLAVEGGNLGLEPDYRRGDMRQSFCRDARVFPGGTGGSRGNVGATGTSGGSPSGK